jgi:hypothetical protein
MATEKIGSIVYGGQNITAGGGGTQSNPSGGP